jgi:hypothetical protein
MTALNADPYSRYPGGEAGFKLTQTREQNAKPLVAKAITQYERGLLSVQDMIDMLQDIQREVQYTHGEAVAKWVLGLIIRDAALGEGVPQPTLHEPGFHASTWTIAWEEGPEGWPFTFQQQSYCLPGHVEAVNHWCLAVYPHA